jgi:hypothetical protein
MFHIRVARPSEGTSQILDVLGANIGVANVTVHHEAARFPDGDVVECDLLPDVANEVIHGTVGSPRDFTLGFRPVSDLISQPNFYSVIIACIAIIVGVVSIAQARASALIGVFISVTTIPAAADVGVAVAFGQWSEAMGAGEQLLSNVAVLLAVGVVVLILQRRYWMHYELKAGTAGLSSNGTLEAG